ncbi:MAG: hypothetical protein WC829_11565 [Hyphomicrobium sp.]|jgi:hypothetical protein
MQFMQLKPLILMIFAALAAALVGSSAMAADQCLSSDELALTARMASVMAIGASLQRCAACLGERYPTTLKHYEAADLLKDFWMAQAKIKGQSAIDRVDDLVRQAARNYSAGLSANCEACAKLADSIDALGSPGAASKLYDGELERLRELPAVVNCQ